MSIIDRARDALKGRTQGQWMHGRSNGFSWVDSKPDLCVVDVADHIECGADAELITLAPELAAAVARAADLADELKAQGERLGDSAYVHERAEGAGHAAAAAQLVEALEGAKE